MCFSLPLVDEITAEVINLDMFMAFIRLGSITIWASGETWDDLLTNIAEQCQDVFYLSQPPHISPNAILLTDTSGNQCKIVVLIK